MTKSLRFYKNIIIYLLLILGAFITTIPFIYMFSTSLKDKVYVFEIPPKFIPENPTLNNYLTAWSAGNFKIYFFNSLIVSISTVLLVLLFSSMLAFVFGRYKFPGKNILFYTMLMTLMIPTIMYIIPEFILIKRLHLLNSLLALILIYTSTQLPVYTFLLRGFFSEIPKDLEDAAKIDGCNMFMIYWKIMLPLATPALATVSIFSFLGSWDEFIIALTIINDSSKRTLPIALMIFQGQYFTRWDIVFAASIIAIMPVIAIFIIFQRHFVRGIATSGLKG
ncbi:Diacetylchitobiose uptake system permease protein NgcG [subsurface metagenome]